jgi:hypothetical protein
VCGLERTGSAKDLMAEPCIHGDKRRVGFIKTGFLDEPSDCQRFKDEFLRCSSVNDIKLSLGVVITVKVTPFFHPCSSEGSRAHFLLQACALPFRQSDPSYLSRRLLPVLYEAFKNALLLP